MSFTSQHSTIFQQNHPFCSFFNSASVRYEYQWSVASICCERAGTLTQLRNFPVSGTEATLIGSKENDGMAAQILFTMKNARKQLGEVAAKEMTQRTPGPITPENLDDFPRLDSAVFNQKPRIRESESSETESLRSFLKANSPHPKAPQALLERIKSIIEEDKE